MTPDLDVIEAALAQSLVDHRLSRAERETLLPALTTLSATVGHAEIRRRAVKLAREATTEPESQLILDWLEGVLKLLDRTDESARAAQPASEAHFSPGDECWRRIVQLLQDARHSVDICVFTVTDDRISNAILDAHRRGVAVRVLSDDDKSADEGSDVMRFERAGIPVRVDRTEHHMHHKFALFDRTQLLTGSYNWTRAAALYNDENLIVTSDPRLVSLFGQTFERLWERLGRGVSNRRDG